jgi:hypothetical protein
MASRDELKSLVDRVPEKRLEAVRDMLEFNINPPPPNPEIEHMRERGQQYRKLVEQRFRETRKPGTISILSGGGMTGMHKGTSFGRNGFHYWDGDALVHQSLQSFNGQEIEIMERLSMSADRSKLICRLELSSAGLIVEHSDEFPTSSAPVTAIRDSSFSGVGSAASGDTRLLSTHALKMRQRKRCIPNLGSRLVT